MTGLVVAPKGALATVAPDSLLAAAFVGLGEATRRAYLGDWRRFGTWWGSRTAEQALADFVRLDVSEARLLALAYREHLETACAPATVARAIIALNSIVSKLHWADPGTVRWNLDARVPPKQSYRDTRGPDADSWAAFLLAIDTAAESGDPTATRDLAIILLLRDSALRRAEVCSLDYKHLRFKDETVVVLGKGAKGERDRVAQPLTARTIAALEAWVELRGRRAGPLFFRIDQDGLLPSERLNGRGVRYIVERWARAAQLEIRMSPHRLRHSGITAAAARWQGGMPALARWARHKNPATTMIYVDNVDGQEHEIAELVGDDEPPKKRRGKK